MVNGYMVDPKKGLESKVSYATKGLGKLCVKFEPCCLVLRMSRNKSILDAVKNYIFTGA
jgi:hypothetical protein